MQPGEFNKGKIMDTSEESGGSEKDKDIPEEITLTKDFTVKELLEIFYNIESAKHKSLEADSNLERSVTISHSIVKMLAQYCKLYNPDKKKSRTSQTTLFLKKK